MSPLYVPVLITVVANVAYHFANKTVPASVNPLASLVVTYVVALLTAVALFVAYPSTANTLGSLKSVGWPSVAIGFSVIGVELGYLLTYRTGWSVGLTPIFVTAIVTIVLIPVGLFVFKEHVSALNVVGAGLCIVGLFLINLK